VEDDGRSALTAAALLCGSCGTELPPNAKFCNECGAPVTQVTRSAEYKQVTVLFADVVHSMDIAAAVGAERLREIIADLADRCAAVVRRYGGTVNQFTGDGIMAVFGAPVALEDHAIRACLAALGIQEDTKPLAVDVRERDDVDLQLRVGLNSGEVIAGEIGSGSFGYTAMGEQVGMAQRMESVASPGGVMLSASTARLVDGSAALGEPEMVLPQTPSLAVVTHRPEYRGALTGVANAQAITLAPLTDSETAALVSELLGPDPSVGALGQTIAERAAGNPFFAEEIVRDLVERGVLRGERSAHLSTAEAADVNVPATLQATIASRIDRLDPKAKRTLTRRLWSARGLALTC
jgi:class 3 adenylate cyclase